MTEDKNPGPREDQRSFEDLLAEAEKIAGRMEDGGLSLDASLAAYEKGVANLRQCAELLRSAEEKAKLLIERDGLFSLEDLDDDEDDEEDDVEEEEDEEED